MHIWTDDKSCLSWMTMNRSHHPLHLYLLQVVTFLKVTYNVTVTMGHVPGVVNIYADAASRQFQLTNGQGPAIRAEMEKLPQIPWPIGLLSNISRITTSRSSDISCQVHAALMALDGVRG